MNIIKKTAKVVSSPVRVPVKKIKHHHENKKAKKEAKKQLENALEGAFDSIVELISSTDFTEAMNQVSNVVKATFNDTTAATTE